MYTKMFCSCRRPLCQQVLIFSTHVVPKHTLTHVDANAWFVRDRTVLSLRKVQQCGNVTRRNVTRTSLHLCIFTPFSSSRTQCALPGLCAVRLIIISSPSLQGPHHGMLIVRSSVQFPPLNPEGNEREKNIKLGRNISRCTCN